MAEDTKTIEADRGDFFEGIEEEVKEEVKVEEVKEPEKVEEEVKAEEKKEPEKKAEPAAKKEENLIPQTRFNEAVQKERSKTEAALARAKELESQLELQKVSEDIEGAQKALKDMIKERNQNLSDGTLDKAGELDEKILELQAAIADRKAEAKVSAAKEIAKEEIRYEAALTKLEATYPKLDPDHDDYNQDDVDEVRALMRGYQVELGLAPSVALTRAAKRVFGSLVVEKTEQVIDDKSKEKAAERKAAAVERNVAAANKQPAATKDVGLDHDKRGGGLDAKTVMSMNFKEFSELGEDVKSRLRGDTL